MSQSWVTSLATTEELKKSDSEKLYKSSEEDSGEVKEASEMLI